MWSRNPDNAVLLPNFKIAGQDALNCADPSVFWNPASQRWQMWFASAFMQNGEPRVGMNYAERASDSGPFVVKQSGCLLPTCMTGGAVTDWDYTHVEAACVILNPVKDHPAKFLMFYSGGNTKAGAVPTGQPYYKIGAAWSVNGTSFQRLSKADSPYGQDGLVLDGMDCLPGRSPTAVVISDPSVALFGDALCMWFSLLAFSGQSVLTGGISAAKSYTVGRTWIADASNPLPSLFRDAGTVGWQPTVLQEDNGLRIMLTADTDAERSALPCPGDAAVGFYAGKSRDGRNWLMNFGARDFVCDQSQAENCNLITGACLASKGKKKHLFYSAYSTNQIPPQIPYAVVWNINEAVS